nr:MAG TPA: hypothetical protein [Caudoviricetes sp.]
MSSFVFQNQVVVLNKRGSKTCLKTYPPPQQAVE